jgi:hypothetical protein
MQIPSNWMLSQVDMLDRDRDRVNLDKTSGDKEGDKRMTCHMTR